MTLEELEQYRQQQHFTDDWWVAVDEKVLDARMNLKQVSALLRELQGAEIAVLHPNAADRNPPEWISVDLPAEPEATATQPEPDRTAVTELRKKMAQLDSRVEFLQNTVDAMLGMLAELDSFEELRKGLEERASFIERSEEELITRTIEFDEKAAELEQQREDMGI